MGTFPGCGRGVRLFSLCALLFALVALVPLTVPPVGAASPDVVISQIYGGGGNSGATLKNDFIELYNRGTSAVSLAGWSVQYSAATGASWQVTNLDGSLDPGKYYLVQEAPGAGGTQSLPAPDATGSIAMSGTAGKVGLVTTTTALAVACPPAGAPVRDLVGYGATANCFEGSGPTPAPSNMTAVLRAANGATDSDNNAGDFASGPPNPRNCGCGAPPPPPSTSAHIHDIQGAAHLSPLKGQAVSSVPGIVTALRSNGFYIQDPAPDSDPATSEGIFVFLNAAPSVAVGDSITVSGSVSEFRPGGASTANLTTTEIGASNANVVIVSHGNTLPAPIVVGTGGRIPPATVIEDDATGDVETSGVFDPASDALDFYESLEGMRVQINDAVAVGPRNSFGETPVLPDNGSGLTNRTPRGGVYISDYTNGNPRRMIIDDEILKLSGQTTPTMDVGDTLPGPSVGILDYDFGNFMLELTALPTLSANGLAKETTAPPTADQVSIATFNVQNLDPSDGAVKFNGLANVIVTNLKSPDIIGLEEVQDNNGPTDDGTVDASSTANMLISAITTAGGPTYRYRDIVPVNDHDGGEPGGNIRVAYLFRTDRGVTFVDRPGGGPTTAVSVVTDGTGTHLSTSPGRIDPTNTAWNTSRKPLAAEFTFHGQRLFLIANHFDSKGGDTPLFGHVQPPTRSSEVQRLQQATIVHDFMQTLITADPQAKVVVLGDINDFQFSPVLATLKGTPAILTDLITTLPANEQYTYDFEGNSQVLDHILVSDNLIQSSLQYDVVHVNSEFANQVSDHEPEVVRLTIPSPAPTIAGVSPTRGTTLGGTPVTIGGTGFRSGATVTFGGAPATNVVVSSDGTQITATTPPHAAGQVDVVVRNTDGQQATRAGGFEYFVPAPSITGVTPNTGKVGASTTVTINGTGFQAGATVTFGDRTARDVHVVDGTTMTAEAPPQPPGVVDVKVTNPDSQSGTLPGGYTYVTGSGTVPPGRTTPGSSPTGGTGGTDAPVTGPSPRP